MKKLIWFLVILLIPFLCLAKDATVGKHTIAVDTSKIIPAVPSELEVWTPSPVINGKTGKVIPDAVLQDSDVSETSLVKISDVILAGRQIVDADRARKQASYKTEMTHEDRVYTNVSRLLEMRKKLNALGFKDESDLIQQSTQADSQAGLGEKDWWK